MLIIDSQRRRQVEKTYRVGVPKAYFPIDIRPTEIGSEFQEVVSIKAKNRSEAANKTWAQHGTRWLEMMPPKQTTVRRISLYADEPDAGVGGKLGRLSPIEVYRE